MVVAGLFVRPANASPVLAITCAGRSRPTRRIPAGRPAAGSNEPRGSRGAAWRGATHGAAPKDGEIDAGIFRATWKLHNLSSGRPAGERRRQEMGTGCAQANPARETLAKQGRIHAGYSRRARACPISPAGRRARRNKSRSGPSGGAGARPGRIPLLYAPDRCQFCPPRLRASRSAGFGPGGPSGHK